MGLAIPPPPKSAHALPAAIPTSGFSPDESVLSPLTDHILAYSTFYVALMLFLLYLILFAGARHPSVLNFFTVAVSLILIPIVALLCVSGLHSEATYGSILFHSLLLALSLIIILYYFVRAIMLYVASKSFKSFLPTTRMILIYNSHNGISHVAVDNPTPVFTIVVMNHQHHLQTDRNCVVSAGNLGSLPRCLILVSCNRAYCYMLTYCTTFKSEEAANWQVSGNGLGCYTLSKFMSHSALKSKMQDYNGDEGNFSDFSGLKLN